ncbi:CCR4-NOT transcription complex, subunit 3, partial [Quaeritorhiza haematococci]
MAQRRGRRGAAPRLARAASGTEMYRPICTTVARHQSNQNKIMDQNKDTTEREHAVSFSDVQTAVRRIRGHAHKTPVLTSRTLSLNASGPLPPSHQNDMPSDQVHHGSHQDRTPSVTLFFKAENMQRVGAFKFRGALNAVKALIEEKGIERMRKEGVVTHSSGNHGQALAHAAQLHNIPCHIIMPPTSPTVKRSAVASYNANIIICREPTLTSREQTAQSVMSRTGASFVHPYNDPLVIAGQGTLAVEFL